MTSGTHALRELTQRWKRELNGLAQAWLDAGAGQFALVDDSTPDEPLCAFPKNESASEWAFCTRIPLRASLGIHVSLCIQRIPSGGMAGWLAMLEANARLIAGFFERERELDTLTREIVHNQDLVLALYDLNSALSRPHDLPHMLEALLEHLCHLTGARGSVGMLHYPVRIEMQRNAAIPSGTLDAHFVALNKSGKRLSAVLADGASLLLLPLTMPQTHERIDGMIGLISAEPLQSPQIKLAKAVMEQAGTHFQNIVHFEERVLQARIQTEIELARSVQTRLLPSKPIQLEGYDIYGESRPAFEVGGDFFDFFSAPNTPFMFVLGDVSGKGLSAALVMTMSRTAIRSAAAFAPSPLTIMKLANRNLYDDFTELDKMTTVFIGKCDIESHRIVFANAGHSPVVYTDPETPATMLEADAPPLGVLPTYIGASGRVELPPGGVLIIATDGFVEAENEAGEMFSYKRFLETIDSIKQLSAAQIVQTLYDTLGAYRGSVPQGDDQTIIVIKRVGDAEMSST